MYNLLHDAILRTYITNAILGSCKNGHDAHWGSLKNDHDVYWGSYKNGPKMPKK